MILIITEVPPTEQDALGHSLAEMSGLTWAQFAEQAERHSLLPKRPETWNEIEARVAANDVWPSLVGRRTILVGQRVAKAFGCRFEQLWWMTLIDGRSTAVAIIPSRSSGRDPWWDEATNRSAARRFLRATFGTDES